MGDNYAYYMQCSPKGCRIPFFCGWNIASPKALAITTGPGGSQNLPDQPSTPQALNFEDDLKLNCLVISYFNIYFWWLPWFVQFKFRLSGLKLLMPMLDISYNIYIYVICIPNQTLQMLCQVIFPQKDRSIRSH